MLVAWQGTGRSGSLSGLGFRTMFLYADGTQSHRSYQRTELRVRWLAPITWPIFCMTDPSSIVFLQPYLNPSGALRGLQPHSHGHGVLSTLSVVIRVCESSPQTVQTSDLHAGTLLGRSSEFARLCNCRLSSCSLVYIFVWSRGWGWGVGGGGMGWAWPPDRAGLRRSPRH